MNKYPNLFSPIKIGSLTVKNRIEVAPASVNDHTPEYYLTSAHAALYGKKAEGGAAIVTIGESYVDSKMGRAQECIPLYDPKVLPGLIETTDAIKSHGAIASIELNHGGIFTDTKYCEDNVIWGPSPDKFLGTTVIAMDEEMIAHTVAAFGDAALMAKYGGCDMVMIHGGHGWLISNFLSPLTNKRIDCFGGSTENRVRFALMIIEDIKAKCGKDFPIEFRMSGDEFIEGGYDIKEGVEIAKLLDGKVDLIHVSATNFLDDSAGVRMFPSMFHSHGCNVYLAEEIKKVVKTPVATVGGLNDPAQMEEIISSGKADIVAVARAISADPYFPEKARTGNEDYIRTCIRCNYCLSIRYDPYIKHPSLLVSRCAVNPQFGREIEVANAKDPKELKKVMIVGGGPGGMQAAITAADRGHEVVLFEKSDSLGGLLNFATTPDFKSDLKKYKEYLIKSVNKRAIKVNLNTEVSLELVREVNPDVLMIAVGSEAIIPKIPGINNKNVMMAKDILKNEYKIGNKVVVIGGGLVGCEEGLSLAQKGKDVIVVEKQEDVWSVGSYLQWDALKLEFNKHNIKTYNGIECKKITDKSVITVDKEGKESVIEADTVIIATGYKSRRELVDSLRDCDCKYIVLGDCLKLGTVTGAVHMGYLTAMNI